MRKKVGSWTVEYTQVLDENGKIDKKLDPKLPKKRLLDMYKTMVRARMLDQKMIKMQRSGRLGTFAPVFGQEAAQVGSAAALEKKDWMFPSFREAAVYLYRGAPMKDFLIYNMGDEWGNKVPEGSHDFTISIPVGSQCNYAVGAAIASNIQNKKEVAIVYFGDGATSEGDFYEGMNFAGDFNAPIIFFNQDNQWAISLPRTKQSHTKTLAQKGIAAGMNCIQVDGNDVIGVYTATKKAVDNARKGKGPTLIEAITYRMGVHTTADDPSVYRDPKLTKKWEKKDPIVRMKKYLVSKKYWNEKEEKKLTGDVNKEIEEAVKLAAEKKKRDPTEMFDYVYEELTPELRDQKKYLERFL